MDRTPLRNALRAFPLAGLAASVWLGTASAQAPSLTPLQLLPGDAVLAPAAGKQLNPEIAPGNGEYLLVWVDDRAALTDVATFSGGPWFDHHIGTLWDIYAVRLDAQGNPLDPTPIIVTQAIQNQGLPAVAWNGTDWLVVWSGQVGFQCCPTENRYAARVSAQGEVLDATPIELATGTFANGLWPAAVGSDGNNWVVVWTTNGNQVTAMRVAPDGTVLDPSGVVLYTGGSPGDYDVTFAGSQYFLVWSSGGMTSGGTILGLRLATDLTAIGAAFPVNLYSPSVGLNCRVATSGTGFFVSWWEDRYYGWSQLAGARVSSTGNVLDPNGVFLTAAYGYTNYEPAVDWDGSDFVVAYNRDAFPPVDMFAGRVTPTGTVLDYDANAISVSAAPNTQSEAAIGRLSGVPGSLVAWRDFRYSGTGLGDLFAAPLATDGTVGAEQPVALGAPRQTDLRLAPNGAGHLAVFLSETGIGSRVLAQRVDASGVAIDPEPVEVATGGSEIVDPSAAWDGSEYLVVWGDSQANFVYGRRLAADLTPLDAAPLALLAGNTPDVAAVGGTFLVVSSFESPPQIRDIYSVRVRGSDGAVLDASPPVVGASYSLVPRVAAFADRWAVVWESHPTHDDPASSVRANLVGTDGVPGTSFSVSSTGQLPALDVGSAEALICWQQQTGSTVEDLDVLARRMLSDGSFADAVPFAVTSAANAQFDVAVAWTGSEFVTAFGDFRNDPQYASKPGDIYGARVAVDGTVLDPQGFPVAVDAPPEMLPEVAGEGGSFLVGGAIFRPESGLTSYRIGLRYSGSVPTDAPAVAEASTLELATRPNPFAGQTRVSFRIPAAGPVRLAIHDVRGRLVRILVDGERAPGAQDVTWDGTDESGRRVAAGVYFARLEAQGLRSVRSVTLLR